MRASTSLSFKNDSGASVMIDMINQTDSPCKITECMVGGITVNEYDLEDGTLSVIFQGGIQIGGAKADVLSKIWRDARRIFR